MSFEKYSLTPEHRLIKSIKDWAGGRYIGDDCALLPGQTLVTTDTLVQGTHFLLPEMSLADLGWKSVAVNLSDIAAMAGRPRHLLISLTLPPDFGHLSVERLYRSMVDCAQSYRCRIVGGDLTSGPLLVISITALGETHECGVLRRSGAAPGDVVVVSGDFAASAAGLWLLRHQQSGFAHCQNKHLRPRPRLCESWALLRHCGNRAALMDASDGLADALMQIAKLSAVGMDIDLERVPVHSETREVAKLAQVDPLSWALYGGEDYELVATLPADVWKDWQGSADNPFVAIGTVNSSQTISLRFQGKPYPEIDLSKTFQHLTSIS